MARYLVSALLLALSLIASSVALADPAGDPDFLPIALSTDHDETTVTVRRGDHLWKISARHLASVTGEEPASGEIAPYWRDVISINEDTLRSGDPDLIYPGEIVVLPAVPSAGR
jgi:nucleoid-associated protein YgaU